MSHVSWLAPAYDVAARFTANGRGRSNLYLSLAGLRRWQHIKRSEAARIESAPAGALADAGIRVEGGH